MTSREPRRFGRWLCLGLVVLAVLAAEAIGRGRAEGHAFLDSSDPAANAVLADTPVRVTMHFTEPLERVASTKASLFDQTGTKVEGTKLEFDLSDRKAMSLVLPDRLAVGTYSVVWQTLSSADGHRAQGYIPFTIGTVSDVTSVIPPALEGNAGPPLWLQTAARWISYLGLAIAIGVYPIWLLVLRPGISPAWQAGPRLTRRVRGIGYWGVGIALLGSALALYVLIDGTNDGSSWLDAISTALTDTRLGRLWLLRVVLLLATLVALLGAAWWWPMKQRALTAVTLLVAGSTALPFALVSHASAQTNGRSTAIAFDMAHLLSVSVWIGGLIVLVAGLLPTLKDLTPAGRRVVLARVLPRFSAVALSAWAVILGTGLYAGWLQVGNWKALRETDYGETLTIKFLLIVPVLVLAAINLLLFSSRLKQAPDDAAADRWRKRFVIAVVAEAAIVIAILLVVGRLTSQAPARESLAQEENQVDIAFQIEGRAATLSLAPGKVGPNHYRLDIGGDALPADTEALLRVSIATVKTGEKEVALERVAGNAFETHGSETSIAGDWTFQVIVRQIGGFEWTTTITMPIKPTGTSGQPGPAWAFRPGGIVGMLMIAGGFAAIAFAWWTSKRPLRREALGIGVVAIALGALLLIQARITVARTGIPYNVTNPIAGDADSIARGASTFQAMCIACHGTSGKGDGPLANTFSPPAADFTTAHAKAHLDAEFFNWIKDGKPGTSMPAFGNQLSDDQVWDVINYLRSLQNVTNATPIASPVVGPTPET
jgi:copper transport protein